MKRRIFQIKMILLFLFIIETTVGVNILQFKHKRADGGATIQNNPIGKVPSSLTFCVDFDLKLVKYSRNS